MYAAITVNVGTMNLVIGTWADIEKENDKEER